MQICATAFEGYNELLYSVAIDYQCENYKIIVPIDTQISTISDFFPSAMLFENEMKELFDVKINAINPDFENKFYRIAKDAPFKKEIKEAVKVVKKDAPVQKNTAEKENVAENDKVVKKEEEVTD